MMSKFKTVKEILMHSHLDRLEAEVLLATVLKQSRSFLYAHPEKTLSAVQEHRVTRLIKQRLEGVPIAYITGRREFWSMDFKVSSAVLIPRHETELLIESMLELLFPHENINVLELGTGCGAIAIAIAKEKPHWRIVATDISSRALALAKNNAKHHHIKNIYFIRSNWYHELPKEKYHAIVSNPPYIAERDPHLEIGDLPFEPRQALISGIDGLDAIRLIITNAKSYLLPNGWLILEHGYDQAEKVRDLFFANDFYAIETKQDYNFVPRITLGCLK